MVVKIPMTVEGLKAVKVLSSEGIKTNVTLIFSANQALLAARAGATYVSPFLGRLDDISVPGIDLQPQRPVRRYICAGLVLLAENSLVILLEFVDALIGQRMLRALYDNAVRNRSDISTWPFRRQTPAIRDFRSAVRQWLTSCGQST